MLTDSLVCFFMPQLTAEGWVMQTLRTLRDTGRGPPSAGDLSQEGIRREAKDRPRVKDIGVLPLHSFIFFF